jgi:integrase
MPKSNLTEREIARMAAPDPSGRQVLHWDSDLKGFAVLCSGTTNAKTFIIQRDVNGKSRRMTVAAVNETTLDGAKKIAADMLLDLRHGIDPKNKDGAATLQTTLDKYIVTRRNLSPASIRVYRQIEKYLEPWLELQLRKINADMIESRHQSLADEVGKFTANGVMRTFRALWNFYAERVPDLPPNPVRILKQQWFAEPRRKRMIAADKMADFYRAVCALDNHITRDLLLLLTFTGLRKGEASSLRWDNIDLQQRTMTLSAAATKGKRVMVFPLSDIVHDMLVARRALGNAKFVFPGSGKHGHISDLQGPLRIIAKQTGIVFSPHDLRRGFSTAANSVGVSMTTLKALLNHAPGSDVTEGYICFSPDQLREPVQLITDKLKVLCGIKPPVAGNVTRLGRKQISRNGHPAVSQR